MKVGVIDWNSLFIYFVSDDCSYLLLIVILDYWDYKMIDVIGCLICIEMFDIIDK